MLILGVPVLSEYALLAEMLESVRDGTRRPDHYVVVDNGGSLLEHKMPVPLWIISPGKNLGVAAAWNTVLRDFPEADVVLANDDIRVTETGLENMLAAPEPIVLGAPAVQHQVTSGFEYQGGFELFLIRPEAVHVLGYFDEKFWPGYFEDNDYARRAQLAKVPFGSAPAVAHHHGSATMKALSETAKDHVHAFFDKNRDYYARKWGGPPGAEVHEVPFGG